MARARRTRRTVVAAPARLALVSAVVGANVIGAGVVLVLSAGALPEGPLADPARVRLINYALFGG